MRNWPLFNYFAYSAANDVTIGVFLVVMPWLASSGGDSSVVGRMFLLGCGVSFVLAPIVGSIVDRFKRDAFLWISQMLRIFGLMTTALLFHRQSLRLGLVVYVLVNALVSVIEAGALDGVLQNIVAQRERGRCVLKLSFMRQGLIITSSAITGLILHKVSPPGIISALAALSFVQCICVLGFSKVRINSTTREQLKVFDFDSFVYIFKNPPLAWAVFGVIVALSLSALVNLALPSFVRNVLNRDSSTFGGLEAAWAFGGVLFLAIGLRLKGSLNGFASPLIGVLGGLVLILSRTSNLPASYLLFLMLGGSFSLLKGISHGAILELTPHHLIGRVRGCITSMGSFAAMAIYLLPSVVKVDELVLFSIFGVSILICAVLIRLFN